MSKPAQKKRKTTKIAAGKRTARDYDDDGRNSDGSYIEYVKTTPAKSNVSESKTKASRATITGVREEMRDNHEETKRLLSQVTEVVTQHHEANLKILNRIVAVVESCERDVDSMMDKVAETLDIMKNKCPHKSSKSDANSPKPGNESVTADSKPATTFGAPASSNGSNITSPPAVSPEEQKQNDDSGSSQKTSNPDAKDDANKAGKVVNPYSRDEMAKQRALLRKKAERESFSKAERERLQERFHAQRRKELKEKKEKELKEAAENAQKSRVFHIVQPVPAKRRPFGPFSWEGGPDPLLGNLGGADIDLSGDKNKKGCDKEKNDGTNDENTEPNKKDV